jgi:LysR family nitrogen assimilation transcriptional regulator
VPRFVRAYPKVRLRVVEETTPELRRALSAQQLHMAVMLDTERDAQLGIERLVEEGVYVVGSKATGLPKGKLADFRMLAGQPLIQLPQETQLRVQVERALATHRIDGDTRIEINSLALLGFVEKGLGISLLPVSAIESHARKKRLSYTLMRDFRFCWCLAVVKSRPRTAAMSEFERMLKELLADIVGRGEWPSAQCKWNR